MSEETKPKPPQEDLEATQQTPPPRSRALTEPQVLTAIITGLVSVILAVLGIVPVLIRNEPPPPPPPTATLTPAPPTSIAVVMVTDTPLPPTATFTLTFTPVEPTSTPLPPIAAETRTTAPIERATTSPTLTVSATDSLPTTAPTQTASFTAQPTTLAPTGITQNSVPPTVEASATFTTVPTTAAPPTATFTLTPAPPEPNLRILYDEVSLTVVNVSGETVSLEGVEFVSESGRWEALSWGGAVHDRLPNDNCLRLRDLAASPRNPPSDCQTLFGLMVVGGNVLFWRDTDSFEVQRDGEVIATCDTEAGRCDVALPEE
jgi:hypothetical protein